MSRRVSSLSRSPSVWKGYHAGDNLACLGQKPPPETRDGGGESFSASTDGVETGSGVESGGSDRLGRPVSAVAGDVSSVGIETGDVLEVKRE